MGRSIRDILIEPGDSLKSAGIINHSSEARAIVAKVLNREVNRVHPAMNMEISDEDMARIREFAARRIAGEPLQLITGCVGFYDCILQCEDGVFIPRIETELLVDMALKYLYDFPPDIPAVVLDLGCGCGAISIALALSEPHHHYHAVDSSQKAIELAKKNAELNNVADKINFMAGDYFEPLLGWDDVKFDVITANPPYIRTDDIKKLPKDVKDWDPRESLDGGEDGLEHYIKIGSELHKFLDTEGAAIFEIDPAYVEPLKIKFHEYGLEISSVYQDFDGNNRAIEVRIRER